MSPILYAALLVIAGLLGVCGIVWALGFSEARHEQSHGIGDEDDSYQFAEHNIVRRGR